MLQKIIGAVFACRVHSAVNAKFFVCCICCVVMPMYLNENASCYVRFVQTISGFLKFNLVCRCQGLCSKYSIVFPMKTDSESSGGRNPATIILGWVLKLIRRKIASAARLMSKFTRQFYRNFLSVKVYPVLFHKGWNLANVSKMCVYTAVGLRRQSSSAEI